MNNTFLKEGMRVSFITILGNIALFIFKFIAGVIGKSSAMLSDSIHSLSDILSTLVVMIGIKLSSKSADIEHPYGHERMESVASLILSVFLFITGMGIGINGIQMIFFMDYSSIQTPTIIALVAAIVSIISKEIMYWYTKIVAKKIKSGALMADAWHHRSDVLASIGSLCGVGGAIMGFKLLDPIASIAICFFVLKVAYDVFKDSTSKIVDQSCSDNFIKKISDLIIDIDGVLNIDDIKTRLFGNKIYIDLEICVDENLMVSDAHDIAHNVHDVIVAEFIDVKHCTIHVNPR